MGLCPRDGLWIEPIVQPGRQRFGIEARTGGRRVRANS
jgi:hypothetical protein